MKFSWKEEGFRDKPKLVEASNNEKLYRAWGGDASRKLGNCERAGVCFSLDKAISRVDAEYLYSVMEYQNPVQYLTEFIIEKGTPYWAGEVDPGDDKAALGSCYGRQVFVERIYLDKVTEVITQALKDDLSPFWLYTGPKSKLSC